MLGSVRMGRVSMQVSGNCGVKADAAGCDGKVLRGNCSTRNVITKRPREIQVSQQTSRTRCGLAVLQPGFLVDRGRASRDEFGQ
jgi:hypothetical protein